jgi:hypothetical protein
VIETNNQSEVGTKVFFSKSYKRSGGKIMAVKFANDDPHFFVLMQTHKVTFFRIDPEAGDVSSVQFRWRNQWQGRAGCANTKTSSSVPMTNSSTPARKTAMSQKYPSNKVLL